MSKNAEHLIGDDRLGGALVKSSAADTGSSILPVGGLEVSQELHGHDEVIRR